MREAPSLAVIPLLEAAGVTVKAHDPQAMEEARQYLPNTTLCDSAEQAISDVDVVVILTEWNAYRAMDMATVKRLMRGDVVVDLRNIYPADAAVEAGLTYVSIGRSRTR